MTRLTVHVRHSDKKLMFRTSKPTKTYYYNDSGNEKVIGNQETYDKQLAKDANSFSGKKVFTKMTKSRRKIINTYTFIIDSVF